MAEPYLPRKYPLDERLAYFAGFCAADGHVERDSSRGRHVSFYLAAKDEDVLHMFATWYGGKVRIYVYTRRRPSGETYPYAVAKWTNWESEVRRALLNIKWNERLPGTREFQRHYIRGFLDGDGCIRFVLESGDFVLTITNRSPALLRAIMEHLRQVLAVEPKRLVLRQDNTHQITYESLPARLIAWYLYSNPSFGMARKHKLVVQAIGECTLTAESLMRALCPEPADLVERNGGIFFRLYKTKDSLRSVTMACAAFKLLAIDAAPVSYGRGSEEYRGVLVPPQHRHLFPPEHEAVARLRHFWGQGKSAAAIAVMLNSEGVPCIVGAKWTKVGVQRVFSMAGL